jgi:cell wall-associated protease
MFLNKAYIIFAFKLITKNMKIYSWLKNLFLLLLPFIVTGQINKRYTENKIKVWYDKDYLTDNIPGISLNKFYLEYKNKPELNNIVVAVIDTQLDIQHEDLRDQVWTNPKEISNNDIDDDHNGHVDDINGWNYIGAKNGDYLVWGNFEYVRLVREWGLEFKDKTESEIKTQDISKYKEYQRAIKALEKNNKYYKNYLKSLKYSLQLYPLAKDTLKHYFPKENYTAKQLDSMYKAYKINDKTYQQMRDDNDKDFGALIFQMKIRMENNTNSFDILKDKESQFDSIVNKNLNADYDERKFIDDNPNELGKSYGNNKISTSIKKEIRIFQDHNTKVSGIIAATRDNNKGIQGFSNQIKLMPLNVSYTGNGDEHDKDIAMAIRYAVDNGAKVINMSFKKEFSLHKEWVDEAFKYAEEHNVLIVHCAGNEKSNADENPFYPNDVAYDGKGEICNNFINVGSISQKVDSTFVSGFSNYGKNNVDIFAPGDEIYTTSSENTYGFDSGTSLAAPMVSGTAALIWLYYPKLTAAQVKQIIMDSGVAYDMEVIVPGTKDKKVKFSELSKSGKVVNVYNAMLMAKKMAKKISN